MRKRVVPVRDTGSGSTFPSITAAARALGVCVASLSEAITAGRPCKGRLFVYEATDTYCPCCKSKLDQQAA